LPSKNQYSIVLDPDIAAELDTRGDNRSAVIRRDLERLCTLYQRSLPRDLTEKEACLIVDVLNGTLMDANTAHMLYAEVEDGIALEGLAEKWDVDGPDMVEKLKVLSDIQCLAVIDACERFWSTPDDRRSIPETVREMFRIKEA
jgi:hypothetical protein